MSQGLPVIGIPGMPPGDPATLRHGRQAWHALADELGGAFQDVAGALSALDWSGAGASAFEQNTGAAHQGSRSDFEHLRTFGDKLKEAGDRIEEAQNICKVSLVAAGVAAAAGLGLTIVSLGASDAVAAAEIGADAAAVVAEETALEAFLGLIENAIVGIAQNFVRNFATQFVVNVVSQEGGSLLDGHGLTMPDFEQVLMYSVLGAVLPSGRLATAMLSSVGTDALVQEITTGHVDPMEVGLTAATVGVLHVGRVKLTPKEPLAEADGQLMLPGFEPSPPPVEELGAESSVIAQLDASLEDIGQEVADDYRIVEVSGDEFRWGTAEEGTKLLVQDVYRGAHGGAQE